MLNGSLITVQLVRDIQIWHYKHCLYCWRNNHQKVANFWFCAQAVDGRFFFVPPFYLNTVNVIFFLYRQVLEDMEMISAFTSILHVPNLSKPEHVLSVLEENDIFSKQELAALAKKMNNHKWVSILSPAFFFSIYVFYAKIPFFSQGIHWH